MHRDQLVLVVVDLLRDATAAAAVLTATVENHNSQQAELACQIDR